MCLRKIYSLEKKLFDFQIIIKSDSILYYVAWINVLITFIIIDMM